METEPLQGINDVGNDLHKRIVHNRNSFNFQRPAEKETMIKTIFRVFGRRKPLIDSSESKLAKVLTTFDLTALGIGSTLGVGVYVLAGEVSKNTTGPAVIISFLIAAIASVFAGLCYAEFGARVPKAGSAYVYSYVTIGEFIAFVIGWNLILEYAIGSASVVKGLSTYLDSLFGYAMRDYLRDHIPMHVSGLSEYPDFFAFGVTIVFSIALAFGAKESSYLNNIFTITNLSVVLFVIIAGCWKVNIDNWRIPAKNVPDPKYGTGGFLPFGFAGVIKGAAVCFYGFIGFDCIATAGEEAKNPRKSIPIAVIVSLAMIFLAYFGISTVLTMMLPYYEQDENAPLPHVFRIYGWYVAEYIVSIGAMFGLCASLMGAMFPLPRIVFAMASDGLLFKFMGEIHPKFKTPFNGTLITGTLTGLLAAIFNLTQLVNMMSIGTLLAYSMVASCVLILRYENDEKNRNPTKGKTITFSTFWRELLNLDGNTLATKLSSYIATWSITLYCCSCFLFAASISYLEEYIDSVGSHHIALIVISSLPIILTLTIISRQPTSQTLLSFKVPFVPWLPAFSILINIYLMLKLDIMTWIRFGSWIGIGLLIYFIYGATHSNEGLKNERAPIVTERLYSMASLENSNQTISATTNF